jgi:serine/threonine protein kinase
VKVMKKKSGKSTESNHWQEYKTMKRLSAHPNVVHLYEGFTGPTKTLYFVMEFMNGGNLYQYLEKRRDIGEKLNEEEIRLIV